MKDILNELHNHRSLTSAQAKEVLIDITEGKFKDIQIAAFVSVYLMRNITLEEIAGFRDALLKLCHPVKLTGEPFIDIVGTGGDGKKTFNISTLASIVVAGAGYKVAKHGNYGVSSISGASNVLEYLGYKFTNDQSKLQNQFDTYGFCFLHAPLFHPALKSVSNIRTALGIKTFFNMLGPLVNPALPAYHCLGVFSIKLLRIYHFLYQQSTHKYTILHGLDGYDEVSLTGKIMMATPSGQTILDSNYFQLPTYKQSDLFGGNSIKEASRIFINVLNNTATQAQKDVTIANAALAIQTLCPEKNIAQCVNEAKNSLSSGAAYRLFSNLIKNQ